MFSSIINLAVDSLAAYRLTKLIVEDEITSDLRETAINAAYDSGHDKLGYLLSCPHCVSVYTAAFTNGLRFVSPKAATLVNGALASAALVSLYYDNRH